MQVLRFPVFIDGMHPGFDKTDRFPVPGPDIVFFVILAKGPDIHIKYGTVQISVRMFLCNHRLFDGIHAADRRAVSVAASVGIPGADALEPGDFFRLFFIRGSDQMPQGGAGRTQEPLKLEAGHHVGIGLIMIMVLQDCRVKGFSARAQDDGADRNIFFFSTLVVKDGPGKTRVDTLITFRTYAARQATFGLVSALGLIKTQLNFVEILDANLRIKGRHPLSGKLRETFGGNIFNRIPLFFSFFV